jgi:hypothetical protein
MNIKFAILIVVASLLFIVAYCSSSNYASAAKIACSDTGKNTSRCTITYNDGSVSVLDCSYNPDTKKSTCTHVHAMVVSDIPPSLKNALGDIARQEKQESVEFSKAVGNVTINPPGSVVSPEKNELN